MNQAEKILIENIKHSDKESFKKLYFEYHPMLFRFIVSRVGDEDLAEDIVQETFVRIWGIRKSLNSNKSFFSLIVKIGSNLSKDHFKHQAVRQQHQKNISELYVQTDEDLESQSKAEILQDEILNIVNNHLPLKQRTVFLLNRIEGKSNRNIAEMLNISQRTVENQLYRALKTLKKILAKYL